MITPLQQHIIETLEAKAVINPAEEIRMRVDFLKSFIKKNPQLKGFVLGISGGQDSSLAGRLCQIATDELNTEGIPTTFIAMRLPYGIQKDEEDAQRALQFIKPTITTTFNIKAAVDAFQAEYDTMGLLLTDYHKGNIKARSRMIAQYAVAGQNGLVVVGTDQNCELISGFYTLHGDSGVDLTPLSGLNKRQGKALLKELGAPESIYLKVPTADLLDDTVAQPDETELGVTYDQIDDYLEGKDIDTLAVNLIEARYRKTEHKRHLPITPTETWWK